MGAGATTVTEEMAPPAAEKEEKLGGEAKSDGGDRKKEVAVDSSTGETRVSRLQTQHPVAPIQVTPPAAATSAAASAGYQPTSTPHQVDSRASLNSKVYTNQISLLLFVFHLLVAGAAMCFFSYKGVQGLLDFSSPRARKERHVLKFWLPPIEGASVLSIVLAFVWQKAVRLYPTVIVHFILWASFFATVPVKISPLDGSPLG